MRGVTVYGKEEYRRQDSNSVINFNKEKFRKEKAVNYEHIDSTLPPYDAEIFLTQLFFNWLQYVQQFVSD